MDFVIIGNGVAGITAALTLREREKNARVAVISGESDYFFSRTALMYAFMDRMNVRDLEPYERGVWKKQRIDLVRDYVVDLDAASRRVRLRSGAAVRYDRLLIATGATPNRIPWTGLDSVREGIVNFVSLQDLAECERLTRPGGRAVVVGGGLIGIELVECLRFHRMHVTFLVREPWYWPIALGREESTMVSTHMRRHGVELLVDEVVSEVTADSRGRVAGVTTEGGRRIECEILGVTAGVRPAVDWLKNVTTPPEIGRGVVVGPDFATSLDNIWAAGDVAEIRRPGERPLVEQIWYSAKRQGRLAALAMLGDPVDYRPPIFFNSSKFFEIEFTTVGKVFEKPVSPRDLVAGPAPGSRHFYSRVPGRDVSIRIVERDRAVTGFNMLGSRWNHAVLSRWIEERRSLSDVVGRLQDAQFDVEFGRLQLAGIRAEYERWEHTAGAEVFAGQPAAEEGRS